MKKATKERRRKIATRFHGPIWLPLVVVGLAVCTSPDDPAPEFFPDIVVARPGDTLAVFPPPGDTSVFLARVNGLALADDEQSVYILDDGNYQVHHIDLDGNLLASMGGQGEGPGELAGPLAIQGDEGGGVWVLDNENQRATHFAADGETVETVNMAGGAGVKELPIPGDVRQRIAEVEVEPGAQLAPLHRVEMAGGRLWAISVGMGDPLTFTIPLQEGEPSIRVLAEGLHNWREGLVVKDIIVLDDRMIVARDIQVLILEWSPESG